MTEPAEDRHNFLYTSRGNAIDVGGVLGGDVEGDGVARAQHYTQSKSVAVVGISLRVRRRGIRLLSPLRTFVSSHPAISPGCQ